jgi:hypothetical protein
VLLRLVVVFQGTAAARTSGTAYAPGCNSGPRAGCSGTATCRCRCCCCCCAAALPPKFIPMPRMLPYVPPVALDCCCLAVAARTPGTAYAPGCNSGPRAGCSGTATCHCCCWCCCCCDAGVVVWQPIASHATYNSVHASGNAGLLSLSLLLLLKQILHARQSYSHPIAPAVAAVLAACCCMAAPCCSRCISCKDIL